MDKNNIKYSIELRFEEIKLPPFHDILVLGKNSPQGKKGLYRSFQLLVPNDFQLIEVEDGKTEAIFINKKVLAKMPLDKVIEILKKKVFPFVSEGELLKVDFKISVFSRIDFEEI